MKEKILKQIMKEYGLKNKPYTVTPCDGIRISNKYATAEINIKLTNHTVFTEYRSYVDDVTVYISSGLVVVLCSNMRYNLYPLY